MKKLSFLSLLFVMLLISCGPKPEEKVKDFALKFGDFVNTNQKDSIQKYYPEFNLTDSLTTLALGNITVTAADSDGNYIIEYSPATSITVKDDKGDIKVMESSGLFKYPEEKIEVAKKTGMWEENLSDVKMSERMNDEEFFNFISKKMNFYPDKILTVNSKLKVTKIDEQMHSDEIYGYYTITNNTDQTIHASDYKMNFADSHEGGGEQGIKRYSEQGKEISPGETIKIEVKNYSGQGGEHEDHHLVGVTMLLSPEEIQKRFASFSGNEYHEYLDSKK